jgi:hypothetical protein
MKLLVDMNLSPRWVGVLAGAGITAAHWSTLGVKNAPDSEIMAYAAANGYVVLTHDPWRRYRLHPDHRNAGWLGVDGVVAARDPHFFADHDVAHHRPTALLLFEADEPDHVEDVTGFGEAKVAALLEHRSQYVTTMHIDPGDDGTQLEAFRGRVLDGLRRHGAPAGFELGESFKALLDL